MTKYQVLKPNGEIYMEVWNEQGLLNIHINTGTRPSPILHLDEKVIHQFISVLQVIEAKLKDKNT